MKTPLRLAVGMLLLAVSSLPAGTHYVSLESANPTPPYTNWATAAISIQAAVDWAGAGDDVLVSNGVYTGGVVVTSALALRSVNGPQFTTVDALGNTHCVSLVDGASLTGFTLTGGWARGENGGGACCTFGDAFLTNCVLTRNKVNPRAVYPSAGTGLGGGVYGCTLYRCTLSTNEALGWMGVSNHWMAYFPAYGGGAYASSLNDCVLVGNDSSDGPGGAFGCTLSGCTVTANRSGSGFGGVSACTLWNSIVYDNTAPTGANYQPSDILNYCCTTPLPTNGFGNITLDPLFVDAANGNLHLQSNSPCINAGNNACVSTITDLDGKPRLVSGTVDIGAYEYQGSGSRVSYAWLQQYDLPTDGSADYLDPDCDRMNNWQEWVSGTCPTNALSALRLVAATSQGTSVRVTWQSVAGVNYFLESSTNLSPQPCFACVASNLVGQASTTSYTDTNAKGAGPFFYRVGVAK